MPLLGTGPDLHRHRVTESHFHAAFPLGLSRLQAEVAETYATRRDDGLGVGQQLLPALIAEAARRGLGLWLNVRDDNPAVRLYQRTGFQIVPRSAVRNRVGGFSIGMVLSDVS